MARHDNCHEPLALNSRHLLYLIYGGDQQVDKGHAKSKKQQSRESAIRKLSAGIAQAGKATDEFIMITEAAARRTLLKPALSLWKTASRGNVPSGGNAYLLCSDDAYRTYHCICQRLRMLKSLLGCMDDAAKQLRVMHSMPD